MLKIKDIGFEEIEDSSVRIDGIYNMIALRDNKLIFSSGTNTGWVLYDSGHYKKIMPPSTDKNFFRDPIDAYTFDENNTVWMITRFRKFLHFNGSSIEDFSNSIQFKTADILYDVNYVKSRHQFFICGDETLLYGSELKLSVFIPHNTGA